MKARPTPPREPLGTPRDYAYVLIGALVIWFAVFALFVSIPGGAL